GCLKEGSTTDPPALRNASRNAWSDLGSDGVEKSTSNTTSFTPALSSCRNNSACSRRGHGQTPTFSIEGASIATTTMSPPAGCDSQVKRRSASALRNPLCQPDASTTASTAATRICGRYC